MVPEDALFIDPTSAPSTTDENFDPVALLNERQRIAAEQKAADKAAQEAQEQVHDPKEVPGIVTKFLNELPVLYGELSSWDAAKPKEDRLQYGATTVRLLIGTEGQALPQPPFYRRIFPGLDYYFPPKTQEVACWMVGTTSLEHLGYEYVSVLLDYTTGAAYLKKGYQRYAVALDEELLMKCTHKEATRLWSELEMVRTQIKRQQENDNFLANIRSARTATSED